MNFAALIAELSISGSRLSDGSPNASGRIWFFQPGGNTPVNVYSDAAASAIVTQPVVLTDGGLLNRTDFAGGIFATQPIRVYIEDSATNVVSDVVYIPATSGDVGVNNDFFPNATTLDEVITQVGTSVGGTGGNFLESAGATERTIHDKFVEQGISVMDFGADPTGVGVSTTAFQNTFSEAKTRSANIIIPAGTYRTDQAVTLSNATGVKVIGQGRGTTVIVPTNAAANAFTFTACTSSGISGMSIRHTTGSTGAAVAVGGASPNFVAKDLDIPANATYVGFDYALDFSGASDFDLIENCQVNANLVAVRENATSSAKPQVLIGNTIGATSAAPVSPTSGVELNGTNGPYYFFGNRIFGATNNILFSSASAAGGDRFIANDIGSVLGSVAYGGGTASMFPQSGNGVDGYTEDVASGGTFTPNLLKGNHIRVRATSTGAAITIAAPTPAPSAGQYGIRFFLDIFNNAGGAISNPYTMNAIYHLATVPNQTDLNHNLYELLWDASASVWRQAALSVTT